MFSHKRTIMLCILHTDIVSKTVTYDIRFANYTGSRGITPYICKKSANPHVILFSSSKYIRLQRNKILKNEKNMVKVFLSFSFSLLYYFKSQNDKFVCENNY